MYQGGRGRGVVRCMGGVRVVEGRGPAVLSLYG